MHQGIHWRPRYQLSSTTHKRIWFLSTIELVNLLEQEKHIGKQGRMANRLIHTDLVILDELTHHCHIIETRNDGYRFKHSTRREKLNENQGNEP